MNVIFKILKQKIEEEFGEKILYSRQCEALTEAILEKTGQRLSLVTLKRLLGFTSSEVMPRLSTLDIIASYCGYKDYESLKGALMDSSLVSDFKFTEIIETKNLEKGSQIILRYDPDRMIHLEYLGESFFIVKESFNSKLQIGDKVKIQSFNKGFELIASEVIREGVNLGSYIAAKQGGITSIERSMH